MSIFLLTIVFLLQNKMFWFYRWLKRQKEHLERAKTKDFISLYALYPSAPPLSAEAPPDSSFFPLKTCLLLGLCQSLACCGLCASFNPCCSTFVHSYVCFIFSHLFLTHFISSLSFYASIFTLRHLTQYWKAFHKRVHCWHY